MNPLFIVYIALIETITSSAGYKLLYCAEMPQFLQAVGSNGLARHTQFPYALASFSRFGKHWCYVALDKIHFYAKTATSSERRLKKNLFKTSYFISRSRRISRSVRAFASAPILSVPLGADSGACARRGTPATGLVNPAILCR